MFEIVLFYAIMVALAAVIVCVAIGIAAYSLVLAVVAGVALLIVALGAYVEYSVLRAINAIRKKEGKEPYKWYQVRGGW